MHYENNQSVDIQQRLIPSNLCLYALEKYREANITSNLCMYMEGVGFAMDLAIYPWLSESPRDIPFSISQVLWTYWFWRYHESSHFAIWFLVDCPEYNNGYTYCQNILSDNHEAGAKLLAWT